ncbi:MAG: aldehyde ferredoxin oxidoreductase C-terminal domain-containing protein, partial [Candidatus Bathyarchaeia archaeon]
GPAGENLVKAACIIVNGGRAAAKCGLGAVMGSKNLKAIAVKGTKGLNVARPEEFLDIVGEIWDKVNGNNYITKTLKPYGTTRTVEIGNLLGDNQVRNFQEGFWSPEKVQKIGSDSVKRLSSRRLACFFCPAACSFYLKVTEGEFKGIEGEGIEGNTQRNLPAILKMHFLCNQYGLGEDETAGSIAWAMECYEKGILTDKDTEGLKLVWGNYEAIIELIKKIALRKDFGKILGEGSWRASQIIGRGSEKYSMSIKGHDLYEPLRVGRGYALGCIVSPRGPCHLRGSILSELFGTGQEEQKDFLKDKQSYENKAKLVVYQENFKALIDSLGICLFMTQSLEPGLINIYDLSRILSAATGLDINVNDLIEIGERIHNVEKAFNVRVRFTRKDDYPPWRFFEPIPSGPSKGECLDRDKFDQLLNEYYSLRGWNTNTGWPTKSKLIALRLKDISNELKIEED